MNYFYIKDEELEKEALNNNRGVICFSAKWCAPCKMIKPEYHNLADLYKNVDFYEVDIEKSEDFTKNLEIKALPTFIIVKEGKIIDTIVGSDISKVENAVKALAR